MLNRIGLFITAIIFVPLIARAQVTIEDTILSNGTEWSTTVYDPTVSKIILRYSTGGVKSTPLNLSFDAPAGAKIQVIINAHPFNSASPSAEWKIKFKKGNKYIDTITAKGTGTTGGGGGGSCQFPPQYTQPLIDYIINQYRLVTGITLTEQELCEMIAQDGGNNTNPPPTGSAHSLYGVFDKNGCKPLKYEVRVEINLTGVDPALITAGSQVRIALREFKAPSTTPSKLKASADGKIHGTIILMKAVSVMNETVRIVLWNKNGLLPKQIAKLTPGKYYPGQFLYFVAGINSFLNGKKATFQIFSKEENLGYGGVCYKLIKKDQTKDYHG